jgi:putative transposase
MILLAFAGRSNESIAYEQRFLSDSPRSGWAGKFSAEQVAQIIAVACEPPEKCGRPVTHWTPRELADEVKKRSIVASISVRQVGRFLKRPS